MAKTTSVAYPPQVCRRLDRLYAQRLQEKNREKDLQQERKTLKGELAELGAGETAEHKEAGWGYSRVLFQLEYCRDRQKDLANRIDETIKKAHEPGLFGEDDADLDTPADDKNVFQAIAKKLGRGDDEEDPEDPDQQTLPVGGPSATQPPKPLKLTQEEGATGVDEHLKASVNELDMRDDLKTACLKGGRGVISSLVVILDGPGELDNLQRALNVNEKDAKAIIRAVKAYRRDHRSAMREADGTNG